MAEQRLNPKGISNVTTFSPDALVAASPGVYAPQNDSLLLIDAMTAHAMVEGRSVLDFCAGSGIAAIAAARLGAESVTAIDISRRAVRCTRRNARLVRVRVKACVGTQLDAYERGPYDVVVCNPPYVPAMPGQRDDAVPDDAGPSSAWDAGSDGRLILDPLCDSAGELLADNGLLLIVQSEFADPDRSVWMLRHRGLNVDVVMTRRIPFGPVLTARARWMEHVGLIPLGRREEELVVIRAEKR